MSSCNGDLVRARLLRQPAKSHALLLSTKTYVQAVTCGGGEEVLHEEAAHRHASYQNETRTGVSVVLHVAD